MRYAAEEANAHVFRWVSLLAHYQAEWEGKISVERIKTLQPSPCQPFFAAQIIFYYLNMEKQNSEYIIKEGVERRLIKCVSSFAFMASITQVSAKTVVHTSVILSLDIK